VGSGLEGGSGVSGMRAVSFFSSGAIPRRAVSLFGAGETGSETVMTGAGAGVVSDGDAVETVGGGGDGGRGGN